MNVESMPHIIISALWHSDERLSGGSQATVSSAGSNRWRENVLSEN